MSFIFHETDKELDEIFCNLFSKQLALLPKTGIPYLTEEHKLIF